MHRLITKTDDLQTFCAAAHKEEFITIDTEFLREKTYWPQLCLIQIGIGEQEIAVDPLAHGMDMEPLWALLKDESVLKVMHAGRQDMEIFWREMGSLPKPIFDTQIAAQVCGLGENIGYEALVKKLLNKQIDKSQRFSDWAKRPLSQSQIEYALGDVIHLHDAYLKMKRIIEKRGRMHWIEEEMEELLKAGLYDIEPADAWKRIKFRASKRQQLGRLQKLAAWREQLAKDEDVPRGRVIRDDALVTLAACPPEDEAAMVKMRGFPQHLKRNWRETLWKTIDEVRDISKEDCPVLPKHKPLPDAAAGRMELLNLLLKSAAREAEVTPRLVADKATIEWLASGNRDQSHPVLHGWRFELFGKQALALIDGKVKLSLEPESGNLLIEERKSDV